MGGRLFRICRFEKGLIPGREAIGCIGCRINPVVMLVYPLLEPSPVSRVVAEIAHPEFSGAPGYDHDIVRTVFSKVAVMLA